MNPSPEVVRRRKFSNPILDVDSERGPYSRRDPVKTKPTEKHVRNKTENTERKFKIYDSFLFLYMT